MGSRLVALFVLAAIACAVTPAAAQQFQDISSLFLHIPGCVGAAWGDYDGDGYPDLVVTSVPSGHWPMLLHNDGGLTFTDVSGQMGFPSEQEEQDGPAWADYDNDGDLDLIIACGSGSMKLYRNDGDTFTNVAASAGVDIAGGSGRGVAWCDYDADGWLDVFVCNTLGETCHLLHSNANGTFSDATASAGMTGAAAPTGGNAAAWGDYDDDGWPDLLLSRMDERPMLYHNDGDGTFTEVAVTAGLDVASDTFGAAWADYDNDGWLDCYLASAAVVPDWLFHNNADGSFANAAATAGMAGDDHVGIGVAWADYDNDRWLDLYVGNLETNNQPFLYRNNGNGTFADVAQTAGVGGSRPNQAAAWADIDLDGRMDLFSGVGGPFSALFHNIGPAANWLRVRVLTSRTGSAVDPAVPVRDAIGARVQLNLDNDDTFPSGRTLLREIDGGSSFLGQNEQVAHFGVASSTGVCVRVRFPDGSVVTHRNVLPNRQITIRDVPADRTVEIFDDVPLDFWAYAEVKGCVDANIVAGYPDGLYHPEFAVTRDQMAVYVARALVAPSGEAALADYLPADPRNFPDVPDTGYGDDGTEPYWAYRHIEYCVENGVVEGYGDGTYHPEEQVTRAQMAVYIARALVAPSGEAGLADYVPADPRNFPDAPPTGYGDDGTEPYWAYTHIEYCVENGVVQGYPDGNYYPDAIVTRDQMAVYVARAFKLLGGWRVVGYLPDYRLSTLASIDLGSVTNLIYFALHADPSGDLQVGATYLNGLPDVVSAAHAAGATVSACVGGWQSDSYFSPLSRSPSARAEFISQLVSFCLDHGLDGVDLNWEPVADADVPYYSLLIEELRAALAPHGLLLSAAVSSSHHDILDWTVRHLSWVGVMAYDMNWPHADHASYGDALAALRFWTDYGLDKDKLLMGIPFYGRNEGWTSVLTYAQIVDQYNPTPDQNWADGYFFNGIQLVQDKTSYAFANGFGGMMVWELGQDKFDSRSLLAAIAATANEYKP